MFSFYYNFLMNVLAAIHSLYREISAQKHKKFLHLPLDDVGYDPI